MADVSFHLEVFDGPLDLLLHLLSKNKIEIKDIPIAEILSQYLEYIENIHRQNIPFVSATKVARDLAMGEVQVRKDLNAVCGKGRSSLL